MTTEAEMQSIYNDLEARGFLREGGPIAVTLVAAAASGIPIFGGPIAHLLEKFSERNLEPDLAAHLATVARKIEQLAPEVAGIASLQGRIVHLEEAAKRMEPLAQLLAEFVASGAERVAPVEFTNLGGRQSIEDVIVRGRPVKFEASGGAHTTVENMKQSGGLAQHITGPGSTQIIRGSTYELTDGRAHTSSYLGNAILGHGSVEMNVREPGAVLGMRVTRIIGPNDLGGAAMTSIGGVSGPPGTPKK
ncbi:hypothetical protein [Sphingobium agri]|uniref:Uncharacterized protein n=1 Tax=Sphingobium agri TaxID=2933566 RepID=A0ABT0E1Z5_9SPHN|nr:hypothetical protein [Sphingobium agri]MCK0533387.1 hypothetical protein [Sphingobium agri]